MANDTKTERLDFRVSVETKRRLEEAAAFRGQSVSSFALGAILEKVEEVCCTTAVTRLSERDREVFVSLLDRDTEPNAALLAAVEDYRREVI
jgi:uncharacterized protein (DUF1778 family)